MKRKVIYKINDNEWFRRDMLRHNPEMTVEQIEDVVRTMPVFIAEYIIVGDKQPEHFELYVNEEKWNINDRRLNEYQKCCILNDCYRHFIGQEHGKMEILTGYPKEEVFGCIEIIETEVEE